MRNGLRMGVASLNISITLLDKPFMKQSLSIIFLLLTLKVFTQGRERSEQDTDDAALLTRTIIANCITDKEKVTAIFRWITDNIAYHRPYISKNRKKQPVITDEVEDEGALPSLNSRVALKVLRDRKAVCEGYARLFKELCDHAGLSTQIITGFARSRFEAPDRRFSSNHTWNAVKIDSSWYLLDATWASGYILRSSGEFVRQYDEYYFLTPPEEFAKHHFPDDPRWTLLEHPPLIDEFRYTPFRQKSFSKYAITDFFPNKGIIEANLGDTLLLELQTDSPFRNMTIAGDSLWEPGLMPLSPYQAFINPSQTMMQNKIYYKFPVDSENIQWLYVMYNNDAVLRYRLQVKKQGAPAGK